MNPRSTDYNVDALTTAPSRQVARCIVFTLLGLSQYELKLPARLRPKNKFEQQCHGRKRRVFKIFGERRGKTVTIRFGDVIIGVAVSAPKCLYIGSLSVIVRRRRNI